MLKIESLVENLKVPTKSYKGDAGWDVYSLEYNKMQSGEIYRFKLGFRIVGEPGKVYKIEGKSGLAGFGITTIGNVIDNGYNGEVSALLVNLNSNSIEILEGDKIAQILVQNVDDDNLLIVDDEPVQTLLPTRGDNAYGSSGKA